MLITKELIHATAEKYHLCITPDLQDWLLIEYGDEPYEGFWDDIVLPELVRLHHDAYWKGMLDTTLPDPCTILKTRYDALKDFIVDLRDEIRELEEDNRNLLRLLELHGITL